ncbi:hypothetical protein Plhal304r1_c030g0097871 [Plasmopara halstedii]
MVDFVHLTLKTGRSAAISDILNITTSIVHYCWFLHWRQSKLRSTLNLASARLHSRERYCEWICH